MRHRISHRKLNRSSSHRRALRRNLAQSLFEHGQVTTTLAKARDVQPFAEKLITLARQAHNGSLAAHRRIVRLLGDRAIIPSAHRDKYDLMSDAKRAKVLRSRTGRRHRTGEPRGGMKFTAESVVQRLIHSIAPTYLDRPGGYTRVIKLTRVRLGDAAPTAVLQLVGTEQSPGSLPRPEKTARRRRTEQRHAFFHRAMRSRGRTAEAPDSSERQPPEAQTASEEASAPDVSASESASDETTAADEPRRDDEA